MKLIKVKGFALALGNVLAWRPCDRENMRLEIAEARFVSQIPTHWLGYFETIFNFWGPIGVLFLSVYLQDNSTIIMGF